MSWTTFFKDAEPVPLTNSHGDPDFFKIKHANGEFNYMTHPDNSNGFIGFITLEDTQAKCLILKQRGDSVSHYLENHLKSLLPRYNFIHREVMLDDIVEPFINGVTENYPARTTCYIRAGQLTIRTAVDFGGKNDFLFKTNMTTDKISPFILRDKLKKWGSDDRNMRALINHPGVLTSYDDFVEFAKKEMNISLDYKISRSNYSGFKSFMKNLNIEKLYNDLIALKYDNRPKDHFDIMQTAAGSVKKKIYNYCGMNITPYAKPHDPYIQLFGHRLQISRGNFYIIEALLQMTDKYTAFETDIERMKLLYC